LAGIGAAGRRLEFHGRLAWGTTVALAQRSDSDRKGGQVNRYLATALIGCPKNDQYPDIAVKASADMPQ
jgi:hypothetical protein